MNRSMTAYSTVRKKTSSGLWQLDLHSVNRKGLDLTINLPQQLISLEPKIREWIADRIERGQVTARLQWQAAAEQQDRYQKQALLDLKKRWTAIASDLGYSPEQAVDFPFLVAKFEQEGSTFTVTQEVAKQLQAVVKQGLDQLIAMKETEGQFLAQDIKARLKAIEALLSKVERKAPEAAAHFRRKMEAKMQELSLVPPEAQERILREVVIFAEKTDITEELTRLSSHIDQFRALLKSKKLSSGKTLDFLVQEMGREINTIGAKAPDAQLTVALKSELEKIREQIQNIE
jgi:uncharacterized protein (TIGR00255 family)